MNLVDIVIDDITSQVGAQTTIRAAHLPLHYDTNHYCVWESKFLRDT